MPDRSDIDPFLGPFAPDLGWVPAPRYLLRRDRILRAIRRIDPCKVLDIGCGPGMLLHELGTRHFECHGLETSDDARSIAETFSVRCGGESRFYAQPEAAWAGAFPLITAFEVLEHIEDDASALHQWRSWLSETGTLLLSVPAHQARWNARDVWAGHVRRYERQQLQSLFVQTGFEVERIECYGFPLANVLERISARRYAAHERVKSDQDIASRDSNTAQSGIDRSDDLKWYPLLRSLPGRMALMTAIHAQRPFLQTEWGNGYLVRARRRG